MNGQSAINHPTNPTEQLIGKFHVVNIDKLPTNSINNSHDETANIPTGQQQTIPPVPASSSTADESACASRFQMIRVDRNFGRGRWKVNDYEPPENLSNSNNPPVNTIENESTNMPNSTASSSIPPASTSAANTTLVTNAPTNLSNDSNTPSSAAIAATVATAAAATVTAFQQQQQRLAMVPPPNVPPPAGFHPYPTAALANMPAPNQSYLLPNHHQFGYYPYFPPHYSPYAAQWATLPAPNPYLPPPMPPSQLPPGNLGDPLRLADTDIAGDNPAMSSNPFPNATADHLQNAQLATAASFIYAPHHPHSAYVPQPPPTTASPYSTIGSYHPAPPLPTIIPPPTQPLSLPQIFPSNNTTDLSYQGPPPQQQAPILTSPKHEAPSTRNSNQQSNAPKPTATTAASSTAPVKLPTNTITNSFNTDTLKTTNATQITDLLSSSPSLPNSQQPPASLLSPIAVQAMNPNKTATSSLNDIWSYGTTNSPLNLSHTTAQTAAATAVAAMGLLNNENSQGAEIASEILKELTTPTKQNISTFCLSERRARLRPRRQRSTTDIDNKISAAMDLVKAHLLSAVREEVTELRQQIRTLNEKVNSVEHENAFLRQHVPSEIYAQYVPLPVNLVAVNDGTNSSTSATTTMTTTTANTVPSSSSAASSQPIPMTSLSSLPLAAVQQIPSSSTASQSISALPLSSLTNFPPT